MGEDLLSSFEQFSNISSLLMVVAAVGLGILLGQVFEKYVPLQSPSKKELAFDSPISRWWKNPLNVSLILALLLGAVLRFYDINFGLPDPYHPDELQKAHFLSKMKSKGTINPHFSLQPPLLLYFSWGVSKIVTFVGLFPGNGIARNLLAGRIVNAIAGTISIYLVYLIGKRLSSRFVGTVAALLLAVSPLHVTNSRYMKEDSLFLTFVLTCILFVLKCVEQRKIKYLYVAGILAGFACGSKYTGIVSIAIVLSAPWLGSKYLSLKPDLTLLKHAFPALLLMPVGFLLTVPYAAINFNEIIQIAEGFGSESRHAMRGHMGLSIDPWSQLWMYHFSRSIIPGLTIVPVVLALIGVGLCLRRFETKGLFLVGLVLLFYLPAEWARSKPPPQPDRYVIACIPFLALLAAEFVFSLRRFIPIDRIPRLTLSVFVVVSIIALPLARTLQYASELTPDTRLQMTVWMAENLPAGSKILTAGGSVYLARVPLKFKSDPLRNIIGRDKGNVVATLRASNYDYLLVSELTPQRFAINDSINPTPRRIEKKRAFEAIERNFPLVKVTLPRYGSYGFHNPTVRLYSLKENSGAERAALSNVPE